MVISRGSTVINFREIQFDLDDKISIINEFLWVCIINSLNLRQSTGTSHFLDDSDYSFFFIRMKETKQIKIKVKISRDLKSMKHRMSR